MILITRNLYYRDLVWIFSMILSEDKAFLQKHKDKTITVNDQKDF